MIRAAMVSNMTVGLLLVAASWLLAGRETEEEG